MAISWKDSKKQGPKTETLELENEIDQFVYQLNDLIEEEIAIVEESSRNNS